MARATARSGSSDSAAAIVTISAPTKAKITITTPDRTVTAPGGDEAAVGGEVATGRASRRRRSPSRQPAAIAMKAMIAATLIDANQNSNSP